MRHPNVQACREWYSALIANELPQKETMPLIASGIWQRLTKLGVGRAKYAPTATNSYHAAKQQATAESLPLSKQLATIKPPEERTNENVAGRWSLQLTPTLHRKAK